MNSAFCLSRLFQSRSVKNGCCFTSKALPVEMKEKTEDGHGGVGVGRSKENTSVQYQLWQYVVTLILKLCVGNEASKSNLGDGRAPADGALTEQQNQN